MIEKALVRMKNVEETEHIWYTNNLVQVLGEFHPDKISSLYADAIVLKEIVCPVCSEVFSVADMSSPVQRWAKNQEKLVPPSAKSLGSFDADKTPIHTCEGSEQNGVVYAITQTWVKSKGGEWVNKPDHVFKYEI